MSPEGAACNQIYKLLQVMSLESVLAEAEDNKFDDDKKICWCGTNYVRSSSLLQASNSRLL